MKAPASIRAINGAKPFRLIYRLVLESTVEEQIRVAATHVFVGYCKAEHYVLVYKGGAVLVFDESLLTGFEVLEFLFVFFGVFGLHFRYFLRVLLTYV